eukprot:scaffold130556_cov81-Phaeocystis_antarctica.AAC.1
MACRGEELDGSVEVAVADHAAGVAHAEVVADDRIVLARSRASRSSERPARLQVCEREKQRTAICRRNLALLSTFTYGHLRTTLAATT